MFRKLRHDQKGEIYIGFMIKFFCAICLMLTVISLFGIFVKHQNVTFVARRVARAIEVTGANDSSIASYFNELVDSVGLQGARLAIDAPYMTGGRRIQLRDRFTVTVSYEDEWLLFQPAGNRVALPLFFRSRISGMSEVFWK